MSSDADNAIQEIVHGWGLSVRIARTTTHQWYMRATDFPTGEHFTSVQDDYGYAALDLRRQVREAYGTPKEEVG